MNKRNWLNASKLAVLSVVAVLALSACGSSNNSSEVGSSPSNTASPSSSESTTRLYTDWQGHEVDIPVNPQRVVFHSETTGDILALDYMPVGILKQNAEDSVFEEDVAAVEDVGFPIDEEKVLSLNPDLILIANTDAALYERLSKIAPTVNYNSFASLPERMETLGDILGKKDEAAAWLAQYQEQEAAMWQTIREGGVGVDETASILTMYPGNRLFVMLTAGLPQLIYGEGGFQMNAMVEDAMEQDVGFLEISMEKLPEYAGDRLFVLTPAGEDAATEMYEMMNGAIWKGLPAVKNGYVYEFPIHRASSDATSRMWLLEELPKVVAQQ